MFWGGGRGGGLAKLHVLEREREGRGAVPKRVCKGDGKGVNTL